MARALIDEFTEEGDLVLDPFAGCGTLAFEAWAAKREVIAADLSPYALALTRAKLHPYPSLDAALKDLAKLRTEVESGVWSPDLRRVPAWVRAFFHPETLREILRWVRVLRARRRWFLLSCLLGILHHQRPGFLSYPSSHTVPYLRVALFPPNEHPNLYQYRPLWDRLEAKVTRAFRRVPDLDYSLRRICISRDARNARAGEKIDAIVTSPPYMRQLDYGRDNRLRLWFLGCADWDGLDRRISPRSSTFLELMERCFVRWKSSLRTGANCVLVIGDETSRDSGQKDLSGEVARVALQTVGGFSLVGRQSDPIPNERRVRRGLVGSTSETVLVLRRTRTP